VRARNVEIEAALNWLLNRIRLTGDTIDVRNQEEISDVDLAGLPFIGSRSDMFLTAATLFLCTIFGREGDSNILALYRWLSEHGARNDGEWFDSASSHNIFRAMVVHPGFAKSKATELAVQRLAGLQTDFGNRQSEAAFFQTINALAHLDFTRSKQHLEKAFERLFVNQNSNGSWGQTEPEWNTFLAVHALHSRRHL
jgi:hypothetical protein